MRKRVAIILQGGVGGGEFSQGCPPIVNIVKGLSLHYDLTVYSIFPANPDYNPMGFKFRSASRRISSLKIRTIITCFHILKDHLGNRFNLLHAFWAYPAGTMAVIFGKLFRISSLITIQGGEAAAIKEINYGNMLRWPLRRITLWTCTQVTALSSVSNFLLKELKDYGLYRNDGIVIPFGADTNLFRAIKKLKSEMIRIIHVANITEVKDQAALLKALLIILKDQPAKLIIVGGDFMNNKIQALVHELQLNRHVEFIGSIPNYELPDYYGWADIMIHSSLHEGLPSVAAEAMASGVVICSTRVGIFDDLGDEYFETVNVGDHVNLARKVIEVWNDENRFKKLKEASLSWAQEFNLSWTVSEFVRVYENLTIKK